MTNGSAHSPRPPFDKALTDFAALVGESGPVAVEGARTRWDLGGPLDPSARLVTAPTGVVAYQPEEMTVRVRTGTAVSELDTVLRAAGQRCALPDRGGTVGGAVAVGENHLELLGRGAMRASVLEVRYVSAEGRIIVGGGPTVKNVTGFDLPRLLTGSLGTLGLLAEVILRTNPVTASSKWVCASEADPFVTRDTLPRCGAVLWDGATTWALLEGHQAEVDELLRRINRLGAFQERDSPPPLPPYRWSMEPATLRTLATDNSQAATGKFVASIGTGIVFAQNPQPQLPLDQAVELVSARIKAEFDPTGRLNPGRNPADRREYAGK